MSAGLHGRRVLLTRPLGDGHAEWKLALESEGASVLSYPTVEIIPPPSWDEVDRAVSSVQTFGWMIFTSPAAVRGFAGRCPNGCLPEGPRIAAVGSKTAVTVERHGRICEAVATDMRQEGLFTALAGKVDQQPILFPRAAVPRSYLSRALREMGCQVEEVVVYRNVVADLRSVDPHFDSAIFSSPSALRAYLLKNDISTLSGKLVVVIGPTTSAYASRLGLQPVSADRPDIHSVIEKILVRPT